MLNGTTAEIKERSALRINPAKTCQPIGAMYAALGIHGCMPHSHGSQGCCSYHRSHLTRHFKDPVMATSSSFTEGSSVFGGMANLTQALENIFTIYKPEIVAVHTTCLSEVIGDDIPTIIKKAIEEGKVPPGRPRDSREHAKLRRVPHHRVFQYDCGDGQISCREDRQNPRPAQRDPRLGRSLRYAGAQTPRRGTRRQYRDVPRHLRRARFAADRRL